MNIKNKPSKAKAKAIIYGKIVHLLLGACFDSGIPLIIDYVPRDVDEGTLSLAIQDNMAQLFIEQFSEHKEVSLSDYLNYCNELNDRYKTFGFYELTIS